MSTYKSLLNDNTDTCPLYHCLYLHTNCFIAFVERILNNGSISVYPCHRPFANGMDLQD